MGFKENRKEDPIKAVSQTSLRYARGGNMKINYECLPCLVNQVVKVADITKVENREELFHEVFRFFSAVDFQKTNPEIIGETFELLKKYTQNDDPYLQIRNYYNKMFLDMSTTLEEQISQSDNPLESAIKYAIIANIIDFNPIHNNRIENVMEYFKQIDQLELKINQSAELMKDIKAGQKLLYLGDNCGEICLDKLLLKKIKDYNHNMQIYFGVRGKPVVNDSIEADAYNVGIDEYASIISNGDNSLGTVLERTSKEFQAIYSEADIVIAKGQANYESLSEQRDKKLYYLLMTKCSVIANDIGVPVGSLICLQCHKD